ncbi:MAG: response regulator [Rikenellaceae bacterium]
MKEQLKAIFATIILIFAIAIPNLLGANNDFYFRQISLEQGIPQATVQATCKDSKGYLWIGTKRGLCRYNSDRLHLYTHQSDDEHSLPSDEIYFIIEDSLNTIWVGTGRGVARYNSTTDSFEIPIGGKHKERAIKTYLMLEDGIIFAGDIPLHKYNYANGTIETIYTSGETLPRSVTTLHYWHDNKVVVGSRWDGLRILDLTNAVITRDDFCREKYISSYFVDKDQNLWLSPYNNGVVCFDKERNKIAHYTTENSRISHNTVLDIIQKDDEIWLGTDGGGVSILDTQSRRFSTLTSSPDNKSSFPENSVISLYLDPHNNVWAGSIRGGLIWVKNTHINSFEEAGLNSPYGLSSKTVVSLYHDTGSTVWIGTDGGGINKYDTRRQRFTHFPKSFGNKITCIENYSNDEIIASIFGKGIYLIDKKSGASRPFMTHTNQKFAEILKTSVSVMIRRQKSGDFLILADSVYTLSNRGDRLISAKLNRSDSIECSSLRYIDNTDDDNETLLIGQQSILKYTAHDNTLTTLLELDEGYGRINAACHDNKKLFWIGTDSGLYRYNSGDGSLTQIKRQRIASKFISSLVIDEMNRLWIGADYIYSYDIDSEELIEYSDADGAKRNEFINKATLLTPDGDIIMGGTVGLTVIKGEIGRSDSAQPAISLSEIKINGVSQPIKSTISVPHDYHSIYIETVTNQEDIFRSKNSQFYINEVPATSDGMSLDLLYLSPGVYEIAASTLDDNGQLSEPKELLTITVRPAWWNTVWAYILFLSIVIGLLTIKSRQNLRKRDAKLKQAIKEQERKLSEGKINFLINLSYELRTSITLIYAPLKRILKSDTVSEEIKQKISPIFYQSKKINNIINMVLDTQRTEDAYNKLELGRHSLNLWLSGCANEFRMEYRQKGIEIELQLDDTIDEVTFDRKKCDIALSNYLINSYRFNTPNTTLVIKSEMINDYTLRISVIDQGIGVDEKQIESIFNREKSDITDGATTGIGLAYVKSLVEMHNGRVGIYNNESGIGATFFMEINVVELDNILESQLSEKFENQLSAKINDTLHSEAASVNLDTASYSILIADGNNELRKFVKENLEEKFKTVLQAKDGDELLDIVAHRIPDVVIIDARLPKINGYDLCSQLKGDINTSHIPIILLSSNENKDNKKLGYKAGADRYIEKPFDIDALEIAICNLLKNRISLKERYRSATSPVNIADGSISSLDEQFISRLDTFISENIDNTELNTDIIVKELCISRSSLYGKLKSIVGLGVNEYISRIRIEKASLLLSTTDMPIQHISDVTGFSSARYFSTTFKSITNLTPSDYRKQTREDVAMKG